MAEKRTRRRGKGSLLLYKTKAGERWKFQIYVPIDPEHPDLGERRLTRGGFLTVDAADDALQDALKKKRSNEKFAGKTPTLGAYADDWVKSLKLADSTIQGYEKIIHNHIKPELGDVRLDKLTPTRIARHYRELEDHGRRDGKHKGEPLSANSVNKVHIVLGAILDAAIEDSYITTNPTKRKKTVKAPTGKQIREEKPEIQVWTGAQLHAFLAWNRYTFEDELFTLWNTVAFTGLRRSEALALTWGDLNFKTNMLSLRRAANVTKRNATKKTKTGSSRSIDLDQDTVDALKAYKAKRGSISLDLARPEAYVFGNDQGQIRSPNEVGRRWTYRVAKAQEKLDLPRITLKGLRHTHATILLELGVHPKVVQERLGHTKISTTMDIYSHVAPTMQRSAIDLLAKHVAES